MTAIFNGFPSSSEQMLQ